MLHHIRFDYYLFTSKQIMIYNLSICPITHIYHYKMNYIFTVLFLPRDATQSAVLP